MRAIIGLALALFLAGGSLRAEESDTFLKVGANYHIWAATGAPTPFQPTGAVNGNAATVKIIQAGPNQWYWVEFDVEDGTSGKGGNVILYKHRRWVNFAQVVSLELVDEPNYQQMFPQGFKIVPYDGLGP